MEIHSALQHNCIFYNYTPSQFMERQLVVIDNIGYIRSKYFHYNRNTFNNHLIMHVISGTLYVKQYQKIYTLTGGDSILMTLHDAHTYYSDKKDVANVLYFHFRGLPVHSIMKTLQEHQCLPVLFNSDEIHETFFKCMYIFKEHKENFEFELSSTVYPILLRIVEPWLIKINNDEMENNSWFIDTINQYISDHIFEKIELDELCCSVNMKKNYFCRIFKQIFDTSPIQYVMTKKIEYAEMLLTNSSQDIGTIAHSLNFADQSHFTKTFKRITGTSPLKFRKSGYENLFAG